MAKKNVLDLQHDHPVTVIGVASNEMIWRLCWKVNQALSLNLAAEEGDVTRVREPQRYIDYETDPDMDYLLFEPDLKPSQGSRLARQFRYWLVVKPKRDVLPDAAALSRELGGIDVVSMCHDLSNEKDILKLIP
ncbi:MAG: hypothetical protein U0176_00740 [Bacteroidia bacterium]